MNPLPSWEELENPTKENTNNFKYQSLNKKSNTSTNVKTFLWILAAIIIATLGVQVYAQMISNPILIAQEELQEYKNRYDSYSNKYNQNIKEANSLLREMNRMEKLVVTTQDKIQLLGGQTSEAFIASPLLILCSPSDLECLDFIEQPKDTPELGK